MKRWFTKHIEMDSWSGPSLLSVEEWDTETQALKSAKKTNDINTVAKVPDWYIRAEVSNDLNLTLSDVYVDKRTK